MRERGYLSYRDDSIRIKMQMHGKIQVSCRVISFQRDYLLRCAAQ